jgi:hypothetical protein
MNKAIRALGQNPKEILATTIKKSDRSDVPP